MILQISVLHALLPLILDAMLVAMHQAQLLALDAVIFFFIKNKKKKNKFNKKNLKKINIFNKFYKKNINKIKFKKKKLNKKN